MSIALRYAARSDVGLVRSNNQDSAYAGSHLLVTAAASIAIAVAIGIVERAGHPISFWPFAGCGIVVTALSAPLWPAKPHF